MEIGLVASGEKLLSRAVRALVHHPKHVTALIAALMLGGGGAAFAVASLTPDPSSMPVREVLDAVQTFAVAEQAQTLEAHTFKLFRTDSTRSSDNAEALLSRLGVDDAAAAAFLRSDPLLRTQLLGRSGRLVTAEANESHALEKLSARWATGDDGTFKRLVVERTADGSFGTRIENAALVPAARLGSATIRTSLFSAADEARIPDAVVSQIIQIFSGDIDFHHALRSGDRFNVVYEALEADGEPVRTGRILSVEFVNKGRLRQAMWFQEPGRKGGYYTLDGRASTPPTWHPRWSFPA